MKDMLAQCGRAGFHFAVIFFALFETLSKKAQKKNGNSCLKWELLRGCVVILLKIRAK